MRKPKSVLKPFLLTHAIAMSDALRHSPARSRRNIAQELSLRFGISERTLATYFTKIFPKNELEGLTGEAFERKLGEFLARFQYLRSEKHRQEIVAQQQATRIARGKDITKVMEDVGPTALSARASAAHRTRTVRGTSVDQLAASKTHAERSAMARERERTMATDAKRARAKKAFSTRKRKGTDLVTLRGEMTPEEKRSAAEKAEQTKVLRGTTTKDLWSRRTKEQRSKIGTALWKSRFRNVSYVNDLPVVNGLPQRRINQLIEDYMNFFWENPAVNEKGRFRTLPLRVFRKRADFREIEGVFREAIETVLRKWNDKAIMDHLVADSIIYSAITYFKEKKQDKEIDNISF